MLDGVISTECETLLKSETVQRVAYSIRAGEQNAIHGSELAKYAGIDTRELRHIIEQLRRHGTIIASSREGYYFPETFSELSAFVHKEERRARSVFFTLKHARRLLKGTNQVADDGTN